VRKKKRFIGINYKKCRRHAGILNADMNFTRDSPGKNMGFSRERHEKHMRKTWEKGGKR
jgi:hypothetical protein